VSALVAVRRAGPADGPAMADILVRTWRQRYPGLVNADVLESLDEQGFAAWFSQILAPGTGHGAAIAVVDDVDAGFIHFGPDEEDSVRGHVYSFYVAPPFSGRGIGRGLLAHGLTELEREGYRVVTLWVFKDNAPTVRLYSAAGFRPDGVERIESEYGVLEQRLRLDLDLSQEWRTLAT
jgi:ribosomal protein S18 acetylase RimI-like enzyme